MTINSASVRTNSPDNTRRLGMSIGQLLSAGDVLVLAGDLAAGKTLFVQGLATGLGADANEVHSPTFALLHIYYGRLPLFHFDLYRLDNPAELQALGFDEYLYESDGVAAVEWGDKFAEYMPSDAVWISFAKGVTPEERVLTFSCTTRHTMDKLHLVLSNSVTPISGE